MNLLTQYTLDSIRKNKRTSCSIFIAVFLSSILLCTACIYVYSFYCWRIDMEITYSGNWHGELGGEIRGEDLSFIDAYFDVEKSMIKGPYQIVKLPSDSPLPYLLLRNADKNYWDEMGEKTLITEGHIPQNPGEIVVAKTFFQKNPQYQVGDTITLPVGKRINQTEVLDVESWQNGETFLEEDSITLTLVGKMDITTSTVTPGYYAMGYLDREEIKENDEFVVYVQLKNIRKTYDIMPRLAESLGVAKNEYGNYENHFSYHTALLLLNLVFPSEKGVHFHTEYFQILLIAIFLLLISCAFIYIIQSVFALSAQKKMVQFGIFRSIGASPAQIRSVLLLECFLLSIPPIFLGLLVGYFFTKFTLETYAKLLGELVTNPIFAQCSLWVVVFAFLLCFIIVWISAWIPAYQSSKLSPIEAIRGKQMRLSYKKSSKIGLLFRWFGVEGSLASASYYTHRKAFRSSISALFFCILLTTGFSCLVEISRFNSERNNHILTYNITGRLQMTAPINTKIIDEIQEIDYIDSMVWYCQNNLAYWASEEEQSQTFCENGGFSGVKNPNLYRLSPQNGKWRVPVYLYGIADSYFYDYCNSLGLSLEELYQQNDYPVIAYSCAPLYPSSNNLEKASQTYPLLALYTGQELWLEEKTLDSMETDYRFPVTIAAVVDTMPMLNIFHAGDYSIRFYIPLSCYYKIAENFMPDSAARAYRTWIEIQTQPEKDLIVTKAFREVLSAWFGEEDLYISSVAEEELDTAVHTLALETVVWCISVLLALIGISTAFLTVAGTVQQRRREYAMLRSVGMDFLGIKKLLFLEGIRLAVTPVCMTIPVLFIMFCFLFSINDIHWGEFLPYFPFGRLMVSIVLELIAVAGAYWIASGFIRKDEIIDVIREDTV